MKREEYGIMFHVEDRHWWYVALRGILKQAWRHFVTVENPRVLDVGCGTGATLAALHESGRATGIDFSRDAVHFCRMRNLRATAVATAEALPFAEGTFDVALSCDVFCHRGIRDKTVPVRETCRVLKRGGIFFLNLPAYQWLHSSHDAHVFTDRRFTRREVERLLKDNGLEPLRSTYWNTLLFPPIVATRLWRKAFPKPSSDLDNALTTRFSGTLGTLMNVERALLRRVPLPFGLSVFVVAQKN